MKSKSSIYRRPPGGEAPEPDSLWQTPYMPAHHEYYNEGDEFLDDAIRTVDQGFHQIDGTLEMSKIRSEASNPA